MCDQKTEIFRNWLEKTNIIGKIYFWFGNGIPGGCNSAQEEYYKFFVQIFLQVLSKITQKIVEVFKFNQVLFFFVFCLCFNAQESKVSGG